MFSTIKPRHGTLPPMILQEGGGMLTLGKSLFLDRSGCHGDHCVDLVEPGSNGLLLVSVVLAPLACI